MLHSRVGARLKACLPGTAVCSAERRSRQVLYEVSRRRLPVGRCQVVDVRGRHAVGEGAPS